MRINYERRMAHRLKVIIDATIDEYAKSFLAIYNNVKSNHDLLKVYNDYENGIYLICESEVVESAKQFLEQFGSVTKCEQIEIICPICDDVTYSDNYDLEFLDVQE